MAPGPVDAGDDPPPGDDMAEWHLRRATGRDAEALATCIDAAYAVYSSRVTDLPAVSAGIAEDIETHVVWVAEREQSIVGGLILVPKETFTLVANVAVDPRCSGMGLGRALMELAESECRRMAQAELRLSTHVAMPENVRLYEHLGWRETGRAGNKVQMSKSL